MEAATSPSDSITFHTLPIELKRHILFLAQEDSLDTPISRKSTGVRLTIAHVCLEWRKIAFEDLKLFQAVLVENPGDAQALLALVEEQPDGRGSASTFSLSSISESLGFGGQKKDSPPVSQPELAAKIRKLRVGTDRPWPLEIFYYPGALNQEMDLGALLRPLRFIEQLEISGVEDNGVVKWIDELPQASSSPSSMFNMEKANLLPSTRPPPSRHPLSCRLNPSYDTPRSPNLEYLRISDTFFLDPIQSWLRASGLPKLKSFAFERNAEPLRTLSSDGELQLSMQPTELQGLDQMLLASLTHLAFSDGQPAKIDFPLDLESLECTESLIFDGVLHHISFLKSLTIRRDGAKTLGSMGTPRLIPERNALQHLVDNGWPSGLQLIKVPSTWRREPGFGSLASRCRNDGTKLKLERDPDAAREERLLELLRAVAREL